jgi:DNA-binding transcriptional ArsR family regulator
MSLAVDHDPRRDAVFEQLARMVSAMAAPVRLKVVQLLAQRPHDVETLARTTGESVANVSQHLQRMARDGLVVVRRDSQRRIYSLKAPAIAVVWEALQDLAQELDPSLVAAEDALTDASLSAPDPRAAVAAVAAGRAVLLDVRDREEAEATPVGGARSIPLPDLRDAIPSLPRRRPIYVCCRGRWCHMASEAVRQLRAAGLTAYRLRESPVRLRTLTIPSRARKAR